MQTLQLISMILTAFVALGSSVTNIAVFVKFLSKPHDTLEQRVSLLERHDQEFIRMLEKNQKDLHEQDETNEVLLHSVLALVEFEVQYCIEEKKPVSKGLEKAKEDLHNYLARK